MSRVIGVLFIQLITVGCYRGEIKVIIQGNNLN